MTQIRYQTSVGRDDTIQSYMWRRAEQMGIFLIYFVTKHICLTGVWVPQQKKCHVSVKALFLVHRSLSPTENGEQADLELFLTFHGVFLFPGPSVFFLVRHPELFTSLKVCSSLLFCF